MNLKKFTWIVLFIPLLMVVMAACGAQDSTSENVEEETESEDGVTEEDSKEVNYSEQVNYTIYGIEPGAGINLTTEKAIEEYESLQGWNFEQSSTVAMTVELEKAIENEEPIIVTAWAPYYLFAKFPNLKYLEDPKGIYGEPGDIRTLVRLGLKEENPQAYKFMDQFNWDLEDMESIILENEETGEEIETIAKNWVENNPDKVAEWTEGVEDVDGIEFKLATNTWESELASGYVMAEVMEQKGFNVTVTPLDIAVMFEAVANGDVDATNGAWMPTTHKDFYEANEGKFEDLGPTLEGASIGLAIPDYMEIDSIEDLQPKE